MQILHHPFHVTQLLQKVNYTMSDFYAAFHQLKLLFQALASKIDLARYILEAMNDKKHDHLLTNPLILCSVFLDPRVKGMLMKSREQCYIAKLYLVQLWERNLVFEEKNTPQKRDDQDTEGIFLEFNFDLLTKFMSNDDSNMCPHNDTAASNKPDITSLLNDFESKKTEPMAKSIFEYWEDNKSTSPELYKLAKIVHAVPAAQASVERSFSMLSFVFNKHRAQLSEQMLQNIMLIKSNKDLFYDVLQDEMEKKKQKKTVGSENCENVDVDLF